MLMYRRALLQKYRCFHLRDAPETPRSTWDGRRATRTFWKGKTWDSEAHRTCETQIKDVGPVSQSGGDVGQ